MQLPQFDVLGHNLIINWLGATQQQLLADFLDQLGIKHDDNGTVDELPGEPDAGRLKQAVDTLLQKHEPSLVALYLQAFQGMNQPEWKALGELIESDDRLKIGPAA